MKLGDSNVNSNVILGDFEFIARSIGSYIGVISPYNSVRPMIKLNVVYLYTYCIYDCN